MKKKLAMLLALSMTVCGALTGCGQQGYGVRGGDRLCG